MSPPASVWSAALLPAGLLRSGSLSGDSVLPSRSAVSELFRFRITAVGGRGAQGREVSCGRSDRMGAHTRCGNSARTRPISGRCWSPGSRSVALASLASCFQFCGGRGEPKESQPAVPAPVSQSQGRKATTWAHRAASTAAGKQRRNEDQNKTSSWRLHGNHVDVSSTYLHVLK